MKPTKSVEEIQAQLEKKLRETQLENKITELLPDSLEKFDVSVHTTFYSADVNVTVKAKRYPFDSPKTDAETVRSLAAIFPAEPMGKYKGSCLTFVPVAVFESWNERKQEEYKEEQEIAAFTVKIDPASFAGSATLEWFSVVDGIRVNVHVEFPLHSAKWLGVSTVRYQKYMGGQRVKENHFAPNNDSIYTLFENEEPIAELYPAINWSAGSPEHPGSKTLYWVNLSEKPATLEAIAAVIKEAK